MGALNGKCDRCEGTGKVQLPLFFSLVDEACPTCGGNGKHVYMCPRCKTTKAIITTDLTGMSHINMCNACASQARTPSLNTFSTITNKINITYRLA